MYCLELAGEDDAFAVCEAASAGTGVERIAAGVATARSLSLGRVRRLAYTRRASELLGRTDADVASARALLAAAPLDRSGSVRVRARDVRSSAGVSTSEAERELGRALVDRGFAVDLETPDHELRAVFADGVCLLGWLVAESTRDFGDRRPTDRPFFQPGSMDPLDARALVNVAGARSETRVLDPMCGTGGLLLEAALVGAAVVGLDAQERMVRGSRDNLRALPSVDGPADSTVCLGDATALPFVCDSFDAVVFDAPYGRQSKVARHDLADLVEGALGEARRVAPRAVVVADRSWANAARAAGWAVESHFERRVHRSLVRHVHVLAAGARAEEA